VEDLIYTLHLQLAILQEESWVDNLPTDVTQQSENISLVK
jgi:hypothetical protein